jgi:ubiquinone/menaquinone biosynthesis C-methylase UbiE
MNFWDDKVYKKQLQWNQWPFSEVMSTLIKLSRKNTASEKNLLEIGCGVGNNIIPISKLGFNAFAIDISNTALVEAKKRAQCAKVEIEFTVGSVEVLPYPSNFFNYVIDRSVLTCTTPEVVTQALDEILRVLKPGGVFLAFDWFGVNHPDLKFGTLVYDNCYKDFLYGSFNNIEFITSFNFESLKNYFQKFTHFDATQITSKNHLDQILTETFKISAFKSESLQIQKMVD